MSSLLKIDFNLLGKPSLLIGVADNYIDADKIITDHIQANYSGYNPSVVYDCNLRKIQASNGYILHDIHYTMEIININERLI